MAISAITKLPHASTVTVPCAYWMNNASETKTRPTTFRMIRNRRSSIYAPNFAKKRMQLRIAA